MHKLIAKIARLAVSKAAAFSYAVAVGVAGNLAFNFVQQQHQAATVVSAPAQTPAPAEGKPEHAAATAAIPSRWPAATTSAPLTPERLPEPKAATVSPPPAALPLPLPSSAALPGADALPTPALKPAALTLRERPIQPNRQIPANPPTPSSTSAPLTATEADTPQPTPAPLLPLGPAVDVSSLPTPPAPDTKPTTTPAIKSEAASVPPDTPGALEAKPSGAKSWDLSDIWHPGRVVKKGLHWAGDQLPAMSGDAGEPPFPRPAPSASAQPIQPIPLLPPAVQPAVSEKADALLSRPKSSAPGPGSGGLY